MHKSVKKLFSLNNIRYSWLLLISFIIFTITFYLDLYYEPSYVQIVALGGYGFAFIIAALWAILNYFIHIKLNILYQKSSDVNAFVNQLAMSNEEKLEIQAYLEDYIEDHVNRGQARSEATKEAIEQFKIKELTSSLKNISIFNLHPYHYLIGLSFIALLIGLVLMLIYLVIPSLFLLTIEWVFFAYGIGFVGIFMIYKFFDVLLYKKLK